MSKNRDERIVHRGERDDDEQRESVEASRGDAREDALPASSEELESLLRTDALSNALPKPPDLPGFHQIWLSTTNTYTPIQHYVRLGYVPVRPEEHPQWSYLKQHSAQHGGDGIACNEMVLYKVPMDVYQRIMKVLHHERPNEESERLRANIDQMKAGDDFRDSEGNALVQEEGDQELLAKQERLVKAPVFKG